MSIQSSKVGFGEPDSSSAEIASIPLRLLIVADLSREGRDLGSDAPAEVHSVDKDSFGDLFKRLSPGLVFEVKNTLLGGDAEIRVNLEFRSLEDFEPAALRANVPALAALQDLRGNIAENLRSGISPPALAERIEDLTQGAPFALDLIRAVREAGPGDAAPPPAAASDAPSSQGGSDGNVDSILSMVDDGSQSPPADAGSGSIGSVISSITGSGGSAKTSGGGSDGLAQVVDQWFEKRTGAQLDEILHHEDFQSLESAWRGLKHVVQRTDFRSEITVQVLHARKDDLRKVLSEQILKDEFDSPVDPPLAAVLCAIDFDSGPTDLELMNELAIRGEAIQAPVIIQAGPGFFGRESLQGLGSKGSMTDLLAGAQFTKWKGLRAKDESRWLAVAVNRFLLREPYTANSQSGGCAETVDAASGDGFLWGGAAWALAACMTRSFAAEEWAHSISGLKGGGGVEDLALRPYEVRKGKMIQTPLEANLTEINSQDLASAGLIPLTASENSDTAVFTYLPMVALARQYDNPRATQEAAMHSVLPYQMFAGRMSIWLGRFLAEVRGAESAEKAQERLDQNLRGVIGDPKEGKDVPQVRVEVSDHDDDPTKYQVCVEVTPAFKFFGLTPRLMLAVAVSK